MCQCVCVYVGGGGGVGRGAVAGLPWRLTVHGSRSALGHSSEAATPGN